MIDKAFCTGEVHQPDPDCSDIVDLPGQVDGDNASDDGSVDSDADLDFAEELPKSRKRAPQVAPVGAPAAPSCLPPAAPEPASAAPAGGQAASSSSSSAPAASGGGGQVGGSSASAFSVPPPPAAHPVEPERKRRRQPAAEDMAVNTVWVVPGGRLVYSEKQDELSAHCALAAHLNPQNPCRLNRTCKEDHSPSKARGRPLGFLLAWLADADRHEHRTAHHRARLAQTPEDADALSYEKRLLARQSIGHQFPLDGVERNRRPCEGIEPAGLA